MKVDGSSSFQQPPNISITAEQPLTTESPSLPEDILKTIFLLSFDNIHLNGVCKQWHTCLQNMHSYFFAQVPAILGQAYFENLCREIPSASLPQENKNLQLLMLLAIEQRKKMEALLPPEDIEQYYKEKDPLNAAFFIETEKMLLMHNVQACLHSDLLTADFQKQTPAPNSTFFLDTQQWLSDFNLNLMCSGLLEDHIINLRKTHMKHAFDNRSFAIHLIAQTNRNYLKIEKEESRLSHSILELINLGLTEVPAEVALFADLLTLNLSNNYLSFPQYLDRLPNLNYLELAANRISPQWTFPKCSQTPHINKITHLGMCRNALKGLPKIVFQLPHLQILNLADNHIHSLPSSIKKLSALRHLFLDKNALKTLPEEIGDLNMSSLHLSHNFLCSLPESFGKLSNLTSLNISNNCLTEFPASLLKIENLTFLDISNNPLDSIPEELFKRRINLTISQDQMAKIPENDQGWLLQLTVTGGAATTAPQNN